MAAGAEDAGHYNPSVHALVPSVARDTVTVCANSFLVLRLVADNPGVQIMHCQ